MQVTSNQVQTGRSNRWLFLAVSVAFALTILSSGCALFAPQEPEQSMTVQEWLDQPRVK